MKGNRYFDLFSKVDTDRTTDERMIEKLQGYRKMDEVVRENKPDAKTDNIRYIYEGESREARPKLRLLRQAVPSLAFLILIIISAFGLATGILRDSKNMNSESAASSGEVSDTETAMSDVADMTATAEDEGNPLDIAPITADTDSAESDSAGSVSDGTDPGVADATATDATVPGTITSETGSMQPADSTLPDNGEAEATDMSGTVDYIAVEHNAEAANTCTDYYKNDTYREDLKFYLNYNDASEVKTLYIQGIGNMDTAGYMVEGNIITIWEEYLDTFSEGVYKMDIIMDKGLPAFAQFTVHPKEEESEYGFYRFSNYYWDYYISDPKDFTFLVFNRKAAIITGIRNGSDKLDPAYYRLDPTGYIATIDQSYFSGMAEGIRFDLTVEFSDGMEKNIGIKIRYKEMIAPLVSPEYSIFEKSKPEDVILKITWNDASSITLIDPETHDSVGLGSNDYTLENDIFTIKKEFLASLPAGKYVWYLMFDTETGSDIRISVND